MGALKLYYADIRGADESRARLAGRTRAPGSAFALSLLAAAARDCWGFDTLPRLDVGPGGKPFFPARPDCHFSLSHTDTHVLAALSDAPVGADIQTRRSLRPGFSERLTTPRERADFDFFELWALRESFYKLAGAGSLRSLRFCREDGRILAPDPTVRCRLYGDVPGCAAAVCCFDETPPDALTPMPLEAICS